MRGRIPVAVVGAGHCGLAVSRCLAARSIDHVVLERGEVANSWRTERWDSLRLLTPNWMSRLPGFAYDGDDPDGYMTAGEVAALISRYAAEGTAPVLEHTGVRRVSSRGDGGFVVDTDEGSWSADAVVVASGACNLARVPALRQELPAAIASLSALDYKGPDQIGDGGVLVVGAAASGIQIADELLRHGRRVTVAVGEHVRVPRRYRGADILWWMETAGILGQRYDEMDDLVRARSIPSMQLSGAAGREALDLNVLTRRGARLVGRLQAIRDGHLLFSGSLANVCRLADLKLRRLLGNIDAYAGRLDGVPAPEEPEPTAVPADPLLDLDLRRGEIETVIWATGCRPDLSWLDLPVQNARGRLVHEGGVTRHPGLYLMGMPFLRRRKSTLIDGAADDAREVTAHLAAHLAATAPRTRTLIGQEVAGPA